jgi:enterochelin esterase family protein
MTDLRPGPRRANLRPSRLVATRQSTIRKCLFLFLATLFVTSPALAQDEESIESVIHAVLEEGGLERAREAYLDLFRSEEDAYDFGPSPLNRLGYRLLQEERFREAIGIFRLNVETHPHVANGFDSLAEAYLWNGQYRRAAATYERLLEVADRDTVASASLLQALVERAGDVIREFRRVESRQSPQTPQGAVGRETPESTRLVRLVAEVERRGEAALRAFEEERRSEGGPIVERIDGPPDQRLVTFVWFAEAPHERVVLQSWVESRTIENRLLHRLPGTSLWYRSYVVPSDLRMGYLFSPDDRRLSPYRDLMTGSMITSTWTPDPLNPGQERGEGNRTWSVLELPEAASAWWLASDTKVPDERLVEIELESEHLDEAWRVVVYSPPGFEADPAATYPLLVFFDGFGYLDVDRGHVLLEDMIVREELPPVVAAFVYNPGATRLRDMSCYEPTHRFLAEELVPRLRAEFRAGVDAARTVVAGRSRSGLGAVCAALQVPDVIGNAVSQSGAFWWAPQEEETEWLARWMAEEPTQPVNLYLEAGLLEDGPNPETGLSMLTVTRHLRDVALAKGYSLHYREHAGGHDMTAWRVTLPDALRALLGGSVSR